MSVAKPQRSPAEIEDIILRKIFLISLTKPLKPDPKIAHLELTAGEILSEGKPLLLSRDSMERLLIDRLSGDFPAADPPFVYLVNCFRRASDEIRKIASMKDPSLRSEIEIAVKESKRLVLSYFRIHVGNPDMFGSGKSAASDLLDLIFSEVASVMDGGNSLGSGVSCPPGFLDELFGEGDAEGLEFVMNGVYDKLMMSVERVSALGNFQQPLRALKLLVSYPNCAKALVNHPNWIPRESFFFMGDGRVMEFRSILGAFLHVSALPDYKDFANSPDVGLVML